jgi:murein DD-endopeptidase MepM/ murein hydrolase activator NlpD
MQIIIISKKSGAHRQWHLNKRLLALLAILLLAGLSMVAMTTYRTVQAPMAPLAVVSKILPLPLPEAVEAKGLASIRILEPATQGPAELTDYYAKRIGKLQAEAIRLKSLISQLAEEAELDDAAFLLSEPPGQGGINEEGSWLTPADFMTELDALTVLFQQQDEKIAVMRSVNIINERVQSSIPAGAPTLTGYISSDYGNRIHPISGKKSFHKGIDFAAKSGSDVVAAADGLVIKSQHQGGYGMLIEIEHGNGYITRYAHNKSSAVALGDYVRQGQKIASVGSTGYSTGPHVHFEIVKDGDSINPHDYVQH